MVSTTPAGKRPVSDPRGAATKFSSQAVAKAQAVTGNASEGPIRSGLLRMEIGSLGNSRMDSLEL
jgi:hypothetical protein